MSKIQGVVKFYDANKNYGFVTHDGNDYFIHPSNITDDRKVLYLGEMIEFDAVTTVTGFMAVNICLKTTKKE